MPWSRPPVAAQAAFAALQHPFDPLPAVFARRCAQLAEQQGLGWLKTWDGVYAFTEK